MEVHQGFEIKFLHVCLHARRCVVVYAGSMVKNLSQIEEGQLAGALRAFDITFGRKLYTFE